MANYVSSQRIRQMTFFFFLVFLFVFLFMQMATFLPAFLGAITFYVLLRPLMNKLVNQKKWRSGLAAGLLLLLSFIVVLVPVLIMVNMLSSRIGEVIRNSDQIITAITSNVQLLERKFHVELMNANNLSSVKSKIASSLPGLLGATFSTLTSILIMYFILYFMLVGSTTMEKWMHEYIPLKEHNVDLVGKEMKNLVISNALGIPLVAILQGVVGLICYLFLGVNDVWFWFFFTCVASMLPFVGAAMAYVPLALLLFSHNENLKGVIMLIYGFGVIGTVDNIFRFVVQKKLGDIHPIITVLGVIIGINLFGFIGLIFGPILISMFILLVKIYMNEFIEARTASEQQLKA